jgi:hypothetical protein
MKVFEAPQLVPAGVMTRLLNQIQRIKLNPNYTEGLGQDLGIIVKASKAEHPVPEFTASIDIGSHGNRIRIDYTKFHHTGIDLEARINAGIWEHVGHYTQKTIYDERPEAVAGTPESREYRMRWWDKDEAHGDWSQTQTVFFGK